MAKNSGPSGSNDIASRMQRIGQAKDSIFSLQTAEQHFLQQQQNLAELVAIRSILQLKVLEALPADENDAVGLDELASRTGGQKSLLERLLRFLVGTRFLAQKDNGEYGHTHISKGYLNDKAGAAFIGLLYGPNPCLEGLIDFPVSYLPKYGEPDSPSRNPTVAKLGKLGQNIWKILAEDYPEETKDFHDALASITHVDSPNYDFSQLLSGVEPDRTILVDVGGGDGHLLQSILDAHKELPARRCILQDQKEVVAMASVSEYQTMEHVFSLQPVKGAKAYFLRMILHDYSDRLAVGILKQIVPAMESDSKLLLNERVVPERIDDNSIRIATMDMLMLVNGGKERTLNNWQRVIGEAGLRVEKVWEGKRAGDMVVIEAMLA